MSVNDTHPRANGHLRVRVARNVTIAASVPASYAPAPVAAAAPLDLAPLPFTASSADDAALANGIGLRLADALAGTGAGGANACGVSFSLLITLEHGDRQAIRERPDGRLEQGGLPRATGAHHRRDLGVLKPARE